MRNEYDKQADDFALKYGLKMVILDKEFGKHWEEDYHGRWRFKIKLSRKGKSYTFWFGQSQNAGDKEPRLYDVLTCLEKYEPDDFEWWCRNFGYDDKPLSHYPKVMKIYKAVCKEWKGVERLFPEEEVLEELRDIQ
jgi:hypothetical protein